MKRRTNSHFPKTVGFCGKNKPTISKKYTLIDKSLFSYCQIHQVQASFLSSWFFDLIVLGVQSLLSMEEEQCANAEKYLWCKIQRLRCTQTQMPILLLPQEYSSYQIFTHTHKSNPSIPPKQFVVCFNLKQYFFHTAYSNISQYLVFLSCCSKACPAEHATQ